MKQILIVAVIFINLIASDAFISSKQLKKSISNKNLIILDVADLSTYKKGHIKGAIHIDMHNFIDDESLYHLKNKPQIIQSELQKIGINQNSKVVIYAHNTDRGILNSSYLAFILIYSGFENLSILDGGYMSWVFENELLTSTLSEYAQSDGNFIVKENKKIVTSLNYIKDNITSTTILDARDPSYYYGIKRSKNIDLVGHIPHSKNSHYKDKFLRDSTLREQNELDEIYIYGHELKAYDEVIIYSNNIFSASMEWYILYKQMGFENAKLYEASLLEWGNRSNMSITRFKWE
ncbi:MAG: rhodanese-like domain-containing protein [Campylobacterota bacterium]|nr:rhodanese-like domain-containing protein [Campylobacterota bacterium]